jgi:two-component system chemotaxis response regulator CheY
VKSILIVEDSATTRAMIRAIAEEIADVEVVEAATGFEALRQLPARRFDLVITDINMPDINGLELVNFIRKDPRYGDIRLLIVSTEKSSEDRQRGMALGADAYMTKPFKAQELQEALSSLLGL